MTTLKESIAARNWRNWWKATPDSEQERIIQHDDIDADSVVAYLRQCMSRRIGASVDWVTLYENYSEWLADNPQAGVALTGPEFGAALAFICERASIRIAAKRGQYYCLDVRLIDPGQKALAAPKAISTN